MPPQPNSPPDNVLRSDRAADAALGSKKWGDAPPPTHGVSKITLKVVVFHFRPKAPTYPALVFSWANLPVRFESMNDWFVLLDRNRRFKGVWLKIARLVLSVTLYHVWLERNARMFCARSSSVHCCAEKVIADCKLRDRKSTRLNSSHRSLSRMPSSA